MYRPTPLLSPFLLPPGLAYETIVRLRNAFYSSHLLASYPLARPVISIGNITLGGTGKTPLAIHIARILRRHSLTPALLSRGYGRKNARRVHVLSPQEAAGMSAFEIGDEPALIQRHVSEIWLGISPDRVRAGRKIEARRPDAIFILDDGFQHRRLRRDLDLVVVDCMQPLASNHVFPRGSLREPLTGLRRARAIIINGQCPDNKAQDPLEATIADYCHNARILHCCQQIERLVPLDQWRSAVPEASSSSRPGSAFLVSGIGNPERFERDCRDFGIPICGKHYYRDHYGMGEDDWNACVSTASSRGAEAIIITEKDAIKITRDPDFPIYVAVQSVAIQEEKVLESMIRDVIPEKA